MNHFIVKTKSFFSSKGIKKTIKIISFLFIGLFALLLVSAIGLRIYFENNKTEIVKKINTVINDNILGEAKIGNIGYKFLIGFPNFTVVLNEVELKDSLIAIHKRPVLKAGEIEVRLDVLKLLKKEIDISKVVIIDATIDLFKDKNGVKNSNIFKPKKKKDNTEKSTSTIIDEVDLENVNFISENQQANKLFNINIKSLKTKIKYESEGWSADVHLKSFIKSLAFNSLKGSFAKEKAIDGDLLVTFSNKLKNINIVSKELEIGEDYFDILANFNVGKGNSSFDIDIKTKIKWSNACNLLTKNISSKLNKFDFNAPLEVNCLIKGDLKVKGEPEIKVDAVIKDNELKNSQGTVKDCNFKAKFTNNYKKGLGLGDPNSAIIINNFNGVFKEIPLNIPTAIIYNLKKPVATGKFYSDFDLIKMGNFINEDFITFSGGTSKVNLEFKVDIVNLELNKPKFTGDIIIKNADLFLKSKNVNFKKTDINLHFTEQALLIKKIKFQNKVNTVSLEGRVDNFLNLYYDDPEKMVVNWKVYSPYLDIKQIVGVLTYHYQPVDSKPKKNNSSSNKLQEVLRKSQVSLDIKVDKLTYKKMSANDFKVNIVMAKNGLFVNNVSVKGSTGSSLNFDAKLVPKGKSLLFTTKVNIKDGEISRFLSSFNNFGIKSFSPNDIKGTLTLSTSLSGTLNEERDLDMNSISGDVSFLIKNGTLTNFAPLIKIGKTAFPNRDVKNVTFSDLEGNAFVKGSLINVKELKVSSNVLNLDAKGTYSLTNSGTNLAVRIPLRNPKDDYKIVDVKERESLRYKGIVVNLMVVDGKDGQTKIKLGKPSEEKTTEEKPKPEKSKKSKKNSI
ncbi:MAG TPA: AsmA-like C-terminal region-containing protein [Flavobacterium sp.]|nr:AsmA-like C-terminal region-containing protein [Flavobacterium sp.]